MVAKTKHSVNKKNKTNTYTVLFSSFAFIMSAVWSIGYAESKNNWPDVVVNRDGECVSNTKDVRYYLQYKRKHVLGVFGYDVLFYEDYLDDLINKIGAFIPTMNVSSSERGGDASVMFFPNEYLNPGSYSMTFYYLKNLYFKGDDLLGEEVESSQNKYGELYLRYEGVAFSGDVYCESIRDKQMKTAFVIFPLDYSSQQFFASRDCLRKSALNTFCINIDGKPQEVKQFLNAVFVQRRDGKDIISDYGKSVIENLRKSTNELR